jgi:hypothetical protein
VRAARAATTGAGEGSEGRAAAARHVDPRSFDDDRNDAFAAGQLEKLRDDLGARADVDFGEGGAARDERRTSRVAMRATGLHVERHVGGHGALVARPQTTGQCA